MMARPPSPTSDTSGDGSPTTPSAAQQRTRRALFSGSGWAFFTQLVPFTIGIVLTPYLIHGFGLSRYGLFLLTSTVVAILGSFTGGLGTTAGRFLGVLAGRDDRVGSTRLLCTVTVLVLGITATLSAGFWFLAAPLSQLANMPASLRPEAVFLFRTLILLLGLTTVRGVLNVAIYVHRRFARVSLIDTSLYGVYVVGLILSVTEHWYLRGVAITFLVQQVLSIVAILPTLRRYLSREGIGFLPLDEIRELFAYAGKVQVVGLANLINTEVNSIIIAAILPVRAVAVFQTGTSFAAQILGVPFNAIGPVVVLLSNAFGRGGRTALDEEFVRIQRPWVALVVGWSSVATGAAWFGVTAWLGPRFDLAGVVATIAMAGSGVSLLVAVIACYTEILGQPGLEARVAVAGMAVNILLTIPLAFTGIVGIGAASAAAAAFSAVYGARLVRRKLAPDVPFCLRDMPLREGAIALGLCVGLELLFRPLEPQGPVGLLISAVPAALALCVYGVAWLGVRGTWEGLQTGLLLIRARVARHAS